MTGLIIGGVIVLALIAFGVMGFNKLRTHDVAAEEALGGIDVQLTRRADLIPNLVDTVKGYAAHEREVFEEITKARSQVQAAAAGSDVSAKAAADTQLQGALVRLNAVAEAYPDLKANQNMMQLSEELTSTENKVAFARQSFNDAVMNYNNQREMFPNSIVAGMFMFTPAQLLEIESPEKRAVPQVKFT
jgi:LemA protein